MVILLDVEILKGYDKNSVIVFKGMGNETLGEKNSDLIIKIKEKKNNLFKRVNKNDLIYIHEITLAQALNGDPVRLTTLDNRKIAISIDEIISPSTIKKVPGEGMPIYKKELFNDFKTRVFAFAGNYFSKQAEREKKFIEEQNASRTRKQI